MSISTRRVTRRAFDAREAVRDRRSAASLFTGIPREARFPGKRRDPSKHNSCWISIPCVCVFFVAHHIHTNLNIFSAPCKYEKTTSSTEFLAAIAWFPQRTATPRENTFSEALTLSSQRART
jgi:hypothetical protein